MRWGFSPRYPRSNSMPYAGYPQQTSWAWSPSTPIRSPVSPGFGPGGSDAGYAYPWPSPVHTPPSYATMMPSPDRMSVGAMSDYGVPYVPSAFGSVHTGSPISPSRYGRDPFLVRPEEAHYGGLGRGRRSVSYSSGSSRAGQAFARRRSSYEVPPVMNPSVVFSDSMAAPWRRGRKKALCIGISYFGDRQSELRGSADNARAVQHFLLGHGYKKEDIRILAEDEYDPRRHPTKVNIIDALHWLVKGAQPGDQLFFHYSGHVAEMREIRGSRRDDVDGYDVIYPVDHRQNGYIVDDLINTILVKKLPRGCRLTALFDAYHSGTALDLPYYYSSSGRARDNEASSRWRDRKSISADVVSWSGPGSMNSHPYDIDAARDIMSAAFIRSLDHNPYQSYRELLRSVGSIVGRRYNCKPRLATSHQIDTTSRVVF